MNTETLKLYSLINAYIIKKRFLLITNKISAFTNVIFGVPFAFFFYLIVLSLSFYIFVIFSFYYKNVGGGGLKPPSPTLCAVPGLWNLIERNHSVDRRVCHTPYNESVTKFFWRSYLGSSKGQRYFLMIVCLCLVRELTISAWVSY